MATAAVTVYWPRSDTARHHRQQQQNETKQYALLGFRVDARTICVVELVPSALRVQFTSAHMEDTD